MKTPSKLRPHQSTLLIAGFATMAGFVLPVIRQILLPVLYLNTHLHELSHALVAQFTGAVVERIIVNADGSGVTPVAGGSLILIASAGYIGASIFGAAMIYFGGSEKGARTTLGIVAAVLTFSMIYWVRGDAVGEISGLGWMVSLTTMAIFLRGKAAVFCCQFLGLQQCLNSVSSLFALVRLSSDTEVHSDASILQAATGIPSIIWALGWTAFSLLLVFATLRRSWKPAKTGR